MKFGYFTLTDNPPDYGERRQDANQLLLDTVEQALAAERLGFHSVWLPEHHFGGFGVMPTPSQCLACLPARPGALKVPPPTTLLPGNRPRRLPADCPTLVVAANGRATRAPGRACACPGPRPPDRP